MSCWLTADESAVARIAPFLTDWPMPTLTEVTGHVAVPEPELFEFEAELEELLEAARVCGGEPNARL